MIIPEDKIIIIDDEKHQHINNLYSYAISEDIKKLNGDFIELGVFAGRSLKYLVKAAEKQNKKVIGVDSFEGMPEPTKKDYYPYQNISTYKKGRFSNTSIDIVKNNIKSVTNNKNYKLYKGFVPDVLDTIVERKFAIAHLDLDQFETMYETLKWLEDKMVSGGYIFCHDYIPDNIQYYASGGIHKYLMEKKNFDTYYYEDAMQLFWQV